MTTASELQRELERRDAVLQQVILLVLRLAFASGLDTGPLKSAVSDLADSEQAQKEKPA